MIYRCEKCVFESLVIEQTRTHEAAHTEPLYEEGQWVAFYEKLPCRHIGWVVGFYYDQNSKAPLYRIQVRREENKSAGNGWLGVRDGILEEKIIPYTKV